jgi:peptidoglycan lytic transglycosylase G
MSGRIGGIGKLRMTGWLLIAALVLAGAGLLTTLPPKRFGNPRIVTIRRGESLVAVARSLAEAGVVRAAGVFVLYAAWSGNADRVKPGDYAFGGGESLGAVLAHLVNGDSLKVVVTIPEGLTIHQIGERLQQAGLTCDSAFDTAALEGPIPRALGLGTLGAEGFLFPATYRFSPRARTDEVLTAMLERFYAVLTPPVEQRMFELRLDTRQLVTLASIIEKEAKVPAERPLIASVLYNRLAAGMPLQSDPTAQYNLNGEPERAVTAVHEASAFNTYAIAGLPPGPIANPGRSSIEAALYPAHTDYLYFVARDDGTHVFSHSFKEHQVAIRQLAMEIQKRHAAAAQRR